MTQKLYFDNSHLIDFTATIIGRKDVNGHPGVILDRTAFYPTGGGQPFDTGKLGDVSVIDVVETDNGEIVHLISNDTIAGGDITGKIDWARRLDHMQQHSGQHI